MKVAARTIAVTALCAGLALSWKLGESGAVPGRFPLPPAAWARAVPVSPPAAVPTRAQSAASAETVERFLQTGWLRGTDVDGSWGVWRGGVLQPSLALRRRFDYLLSSVGEVPVVDMRQWVSVHAAAELGSDAAQAVLAVWDAYVGLRQAGGDKALDLDDAQRWQASIDERTARRRAALGAAWAYAFFSEEDRQLVEQLQRRSDARTGNPAVAADDKDTDVATMALIAAPDHPLGTEEALQRDARRVSVFGAEAAQRMHAQDALDSQFQARLTAARGRAADIARDPQLSAVQRALQQSADLAQHFNGNDLARAKALLTVSSTGS